MSEREQPPGPEDRGWGRAALNLALYTRVPREMEEEGSICIREGGNCEKRQKLGRARVFADLLRAVLNAAAARESRQ